MATRTLYVDDGYAVGDDYTQTGITIDWKNKIIFVPKISMTLIQTTPTVIYQLDLNAFRLTLKELEAEVIDAGAGGMAFDDTHQHNPPVTVGGVTLARVIEIINDYTVTFEDDQYAVNLVGANSNVGDRVNVNQVSVRSANSAGLVTSQAIEFGEYGGGVYIKPSAQSSGTTYPTGTLRQPVNNLTDAKLIADARGFSKVFVLENLSVQDVNFDDFEIIGTSESTTDIFLAGNASLINCKVTEATVAGTLDGGSQIVNCVVQDIVFFNGIIDNCILEGNIQLGGTETATIKDCVSGISGQETPIIDMGGDGPTLSLRNYNGGIELTNKTGNTYPTASMDINSGQVILDSTLIHGEITVRGIGKLTDNTDPTSNVVVFNEMLNPVTVNQSLFRDTVDVTIGTGTSGVKYPTGSPIQPVDDLANAYIIAGQNNLTAYHINGTVILDQDYTDWTFSGDSTNSVDIDFGGYDVGGSVFKLVTIRGTMNSTSIVETRNTVAINVKNWRGKCVETALVGSWTFEPNANQRFVRCSSGFSTPTFDCTGAGKMIFSSYNGSMNLANASQANTEIVMDCISANITVDDNCTAGNIILRGVGLWTNKDTYVGNANVIDVLISTNSIWSEDVSTYVTGTAGYLQVQAGDISNANINISGLTSDQANTLNQIDATTLSSNVTITSIDNNVSNIVLNGAMTTDQATMLMEIYALYGLDPTKPLVVSNTSITAGANITQTVDCNVTSETTTITRV